MLQTKKTDAGWEIEIVTDRQGDRDGRRVLYTAAQLDQHGISQSFDPDGDDIMGFGGTNAAYLLERVEPARVLTVGETVR